jgi:hypothetical protein
MAAGHEARSVPIISERDANMIEIDGLTKRYGDTRRWKRPSCK